MILIASSPNLSCWSAAGFGPSQLTLHKLNRTGNQVSFHMFKGYFGKIGRTPQDFPHGWIIPKQMQTFSSTEQCTLRRVDCQCVLILSSSETITHQDENLSIFCKNTESNSMLVRECVLPPV